MFAVILLCSAFLAPTAGVSQCFSDCRTDNHRGLLSPVESEKCRSWNGFVGCLKTCEGGSKLVSDMRVEMGREFRILDNMCGRDVGRNTDFDRNRGGLSRGSSRTSSWGSGDGSRRSSISSGGSDRSGRGSILDANRDFGGRRSSIERGGSRRGSIHSNRGGILDADSDFNRRRGSMDRDSDEDTDFPAPPSEFDRGNSIGGGSRRGSLDRGGSIGGGSRRGSLDRGDSVGGGSMRGSLDRSDSRGGGSRRGSLNRGDSIGGGSRRGSLNRGDSIGDRSGTGRQQPTEFNTGGGTVKVLGGRALTDEEERSG